MKRIQLRKQGKTEDNDSQSTKRPRQSESTQLQRALQDPTAETLTPGVVSDLQQLHGNQYLANLTGGNNLTVQPKMTVTPAGDQYEQEADAMAEQVVSRMQDDAVQRQDEEEEVMLKRDDALQRDADMDDDEEVMLKRDATLQRQDEEEEVMLKRDDDVMGGVAVSDDLENSIESQRGGGNALPDDLRSNMEAGFGADFSGVRVHNDTTADNLSRSIQAKAFTTGNDIFFQQGTYDPGSQQGQELIAHELTHTIQQGAAKPVDKKEDADS